MQRQLLLLLLTCVLLPKGEEVGRGRGGRGGGHMVNAIARCPLSTLAAAGCTTKKNNNIVFVASVSFFPRFVVAFNRFSAIQNYSRMKIKNMFFGKFNTRVDSAR